MQDYVNQEQLPNSIREGQDSQIEIEQFHALIESTRDFIWSVNSSDFGLVKFNTAIADYFRDSRNIILEKGMTPEVLVPPKYLNQWNEMYTRAIKKGSFKIEYFTVGGNVILELALSPMIVNGNTVGVSVFGRDITAIKKIEKELGEEKGHYLDLIESTDNLIWAVDPDEFRITYFNSAAADFAQTEWGLEAYSGMPFSTFPNDEKNESWEQLYCRVKKEGKVKTELSTKTHKTFKLQLSPIYSSGILTGISVFAKDTTKESKYKKSLVASNQRLNNMLGQTINAISKIGGLRDVYTANHQRRVRELSCAIAKVMELHQDVISNISFGAMIHDIGMIYIPSDLMNKSGSLSDLEYQVIQSHPRYGYDVIKEIDFQEQVHLMIYQHHERLDGSGYPNKLQGNEIIIESRILAVADIVEAMCSHRPYRKALGIEKAIEEIERQSGVKLDADVVLACVHLFRDKGFQFPEGI